MLVKPAAAALTALMLCGPAMAGPMMPAGSSPEAGLAGFWRFSEARPVPWAKSRRLTKQTAPLLAYTIAFADGEVQAPPPLACHGATYTSGVTYLNEAFNGKLAADSSGAMRKAIHLSGAQFTTFRVICGKDTRDFYVDDDAALVTADGDVLYVLERPEGDPQQNTVGYSGPSFDCTQADTTAARLICRDAGLSRTDKKLAEEYAALERSLSQQSFTTFRAGQRAWHAQALARCGAAVAMPQAAGDRRGITDCLQTEFADRADLLDGLKAEKAGALVLEPRLRFRTLAKPPVAENDVYPWMSGGAAAGAFNAFIAKALALAHWRTDDRDRFPRTTDAGDLQMYARRSYMVARFDDRIVSLQVSTRDFTGGNRDALEQKTLTWDLAKARVITPESVMAPDKDWKAFVAGFCKKDLHRQMSERDAPDLDDAEIAAAVAEGSNWLWRKDGATVVFMVTSIGGLPGGEFDVDIPFGVLAPYMRADAPVR